MGALAGVAAVALGKAGRAVGADIVLATMVASAATVVPLLAGRGVAAPADAPAAVLGWTGVQAEARSERSRIRLADLRCMGPMLP